MHDGACREAKKEHATSKNTKTQKQLISETAGGGLVSYKKKVGGECRDWWIRVDRRSSSCMHLCFGCCFKVHLEVCVRVCARMHGCVLAPLSCDDL